MITVDEHVVPAQPPEACFAVAADVERWPEILPHYRWVRFQRKEAFARGVVEMAAWRDFGGPLRWPTWWVSEMEGDAQVPEVRYRHIAGITKGMDVVWEFHPEAGGTRIRIVHAWRGPRWPLIGARAADWVIGPHFVSAIAGRTLAGVAAEIVRRDDPAASARGSGGGAEGRA